MTTFSPFVVPQFVAPGHLDTCTAYCAKSHCWCGADAAHGVSRCHRHQAELATARRLAATTTRVPVAALRYGDVALDPFGDYGLHNAIVRTVRQTFTNEWIVTAHGGQQHTVRSPHGHGGTAPLITVRLPRPEAV